MPLSINSSAMEEDRSVAAEIARALALRIVSGEIGPNDRLRQDHVANEFGVSHVPVREAFRRLEAQGLVINEPRRGVKVAALDPAQVLEVAAMRAALEALALKHAMPNMTVADLATARELALDMACDDDIAALEATNRRFHETLIRPCAMPRLLASIADLHQASARHLFYTLRQLDYKPHSDEGHVAILDAILENHADDACALLTEHILAAGRALAVALVDGTPT